VRGASCQSFTDPAVLVAGLCVLTHIMLLDAVLYSSQITNASVYRLLDI
jgi:hypothetical protein